MTKPTVRRLFWDIEVSPELVLSWGSGYNLSIGHDNIVTERKIICIGYKWEGDKHVHVLRWTKDQDDGPMLRKFVEIANEADELVHHFGDKFDLPWFRTRCLFHKLPPLPPYKTVDTKMLASKHFYFNSNKLDYIAKFLGHGGKLHTEFDLWKKVLMDNDQSALAYMVKYCGVDVLKLEKVYHDLKFADKPETHAGVIAGGPRWSCPRDGSLDVRKSKTRATSSGLIKHQMLCNECQSYFQLTDSIFKQYTDAKSGKVSKIRCSSSQGCRCRKT